jgi:hypothetical protein
MYLELDPNLTSEQREVRSATHGFASGVLRPAATRLDRMTPDDPLCGTSFGLGTSSGTTLRASPPRTAELESTASPATSSSRNSDGAAPVLPPGWE